MTPSERAVHQVELLTRDRLITALLLLLMQDGWTEDEIRDATEAALDSLDEPTELN